MKLLMHKDKLKLLNWSRHKAWIHTSLVQIDWILRVRSRCINGLIQMTIFSYTRLSWLEVHMKFLYYFFEKNKYGWEVLVRVAKSKTISILLNLRIQKECPCGPGWVEYGIERWGAVLSVLARGAVVTGWLGQGAGQISRVEGVEAGFPPASQM